MCCYHPKLWFNPIYSRGEPQRQKLLWIAGNKVGGMGVWIIDSKTLHPSRSQSNRLHPSPTRMKTPDSSSHSSDGIDRRGFLECMAWAGTGVLWSISGGILSSRLIGEPARAQEKADFTFVQISDSHIGFSKEPNKDVTGTLK